MDNIATTKSFEEVKKSRRYYARLEVQKKFKHDLNKTKYVVVQMIKEKEKLITEKLKSEVVKTFEKYRRLEISMKERYNLKKHLKELVQKDEPISRKVFLNRC